MLAGGFVLLHTLLHRNRKSLTGIHDFRSEPSPLSSNFTSEEVYSGRSLYRANFVCLFTPSTISTNYSVTAAISLGFLQHRVFSHGSGLRVFPHGTEVAFVKEA